MNAASILDTPDIYEKLLAKSAEIGFTMPSDIFIGTLLKTLITSKPNANVLELGTGIGLSLAWMIEGLAANANIISVDNDPILTEIANDFFGHDPRVQLVCEDGSSWIKNYQGQKFDLVFADAWPGKYSETDEILDLIKIGGFYVIDDMKAQPNWPAGHQENVDGLITYLEGRKDFSLTKLDWSTGVIIMTKKK
ncbi:MAG: class I SAM-dependent methyltransferase [Bacteroidota bacterium]